MVLEQNVTLLQLLDPDLDPGDSGESSQADPGGVVTPRILAESLAALAYVPNAEIGEAEVIVMETLLDAHHPCIGNYRYAWWQTRSTYLHIEKVCNHEM